SAPDADLIAAAVRRGQPVQMKLQLDCGVEGEYTGANVIAEIRGSEKPDEVVIMGGHLDSWDLGTGAIDDGAGVAIGMAVGKLIGDLAQPPKRTIRVVAFANEEAGLFGGKAYAAAHKHEVAQHVLGSESDFGADRIWRLSASVKPEALPAIDAMMQVLAPLGVERGSGSGNGGPDLSPIHAEGMAALSLTNDGTRYFDIHHSADDTLDKVDPEQIAQNVAVYVSWAYMAAEADGDFGSAPGAFRQGGAED
ncbi:MAG TPA: M20/M25/M40 family metallo-hydrolase, partial [Tahibacter sp.]|nr:M20/M25/M40 family metallo-hydrolase [Tahibacter sp.]